MRLLLAFHRVVLAIFISLSAFACGMSNAYAVPTDAIWTGATSADWLTGLNWSTGSVPTGTATFDNSLHTAVTFSNNASIDTIQFTALAPPYSFAVSHQLAINGVGIVNNSSSAPIFTLSQAMSFNNTSTAGNATFIINNDINQLAGLIFRNSSTAGNSTIVNNDQACCLFAFLNTSTAGNSAIANNWFLTFADASTAGNATITNNGQVLFQNNSSAGNAVLINSANASADSNISFADTSTAGSASVANKDYLQFTNASTGGSATITTSGYTRFSDNATPGQARLITNTRTNLPKTFTGLCGLFRCDGLGLVDFSNTSGPAADHKISAGSIEGAGDYYLGSNQLTVGGNNLDTTVSGVISDCGTNGNYPLSCVNSLANPVGGSLVKVGTGTLTLSGSDTYTGGTTISAGTLQIGDGGTTGSIPGNVADNGTLVFNRTDTFTFSGVISGSGGVRQNGSGTLILTGTNTVSGPTAVSAGTLSVNGSLASSAVTVLGGATLGGSGTVGGTTINSGGTLAPGNPIGTLAVNGNLNLAAGSTYVAEIATGSADEVTASGATTIGGKLLLKPVSASYSAGTTYTLIKSTVSLSGAFSAITIAGSFGGNIVASVTYDANDAYLNLTALSYLSQLPNPSADQATVAAALDDARAAHQADLKSLYDALDQLGDGALADALTSLVPNNTRSLPMISMLEMEDYTDLIWNHLAELGDQLPRSNATGLSVGDSATRQLAAIGPVSPQPALLSTGWTGLGEGIGGFFSGSSLDGSVATDTSGNRTRINGYMIAGGIDLQAADGLTVGVSLSMAQTSATQNIMLSTTKSNAYQGVAYGRYDSDGWFVEGFAGSASQRITTNRTALVGGSTFDLHGKTDGNSPTVAVAVGRRYTDLGFSIVPTAGLQWLEASIAGYTESGSVAAMTFQDFSRHSYMGRLGFDASGELEIGGGVVKPSLHLFAVHDFADGPGAFVSAFAAAPPSLMTFVLPNKTSTWLEVGWGIEDAINDSTRLAVHYDATVARSDLFSGAWTADVNIRF